MRAFFQLKLGNVHPLMTSQFWGEGVKDYVTIVQRPQCLEAWRWGKRVQNCPRLAWRHLWMIQKKNKGILRERMFRITFWHSGIIDKIDCVLIKFVTGVTLTMVMMTFIVRRRNLWRGDDLRCSATAITWPSKKYLLDTVEAAFNVITVGYTKSDHINRIIAIIDKFTY